MANNKAFLANITRRALGANRKRHQGDWQANLHVLLPEEQKELVKSAVIQAALKGGTSFQHWLVLQDFKGDGETIEVPFYDGNLPLSGAGRVVYETLVSLGLDVVLSRLLDDEEPLDSPHRWPIVIEGRWG